MMFAKTSMPMVGASSSRKDHVSGQGFLGRGLLGEPCTVQPVMAMHQLNSQDHFVVRQSGCIATLNTSFGLILFDGLALPLIQR